MNHIPFHDLRRTSAALESLRGRSVASAGMRSDLRQLRLELAARLLTTTDLPVAAIAQQCGFFDQSHLTNSFRRHLGAPPSRYRRDLRIGA